jgi:hypothetical protein
MAQAGGMPPGCFCVKCAQVIEKQGDSKNRRQVCASVSNERAWLVSLVCGTMGIAGRLTGSGALTTVESKPAPAKNRRVRYPGNFCSAVRGEMNRSVDADLVSHPDNPRPARNFGVWISPKPALAAQAHRLLRRRVDSSRAARGEGRRGTRKPNSGGKALAFARQAARLKAVSSRSQSRHFGAGFLDLRGTRPNNG